MLCIIALLYSVLYLSRNTVPSFYHRDILVRGTELVQHFTPRRVYISTVLSPLVLHLCYMYNGFSNESLGIRARGASFLPLIIFFID